MAPAQVEQTTEPLPSFQDDARDDWTLKAPKPLEWALQNLEQLTDEQSAELLLAIAEYIPVAVFHQDWYTPMKSAVGNPASLLDLAVTAEPATRACLQSCWSGRQFAPIRNAGKCSRYSRPQCQMLTRQPSAFWRRPVPIPRQDARPVEGNSLTGEHTMKPELRRCLHAYFR